MKPLAFLLAGLVAAAAGATPTHAAPPNIVFILADDLGYGDVGCYGQTKIKTPRIDRLAAEGMRFTQHYSGCAVCAPSRCVLLSGLHPGHGYIRDNRSVPGPNEGQEPVPAGALTLPLTLREQGYTLGGFGKWGLGPVGSSGDPLKQGFNRWFGYNCQAVAHNYYPTHLWDDDAPVALQNAPFAPRAKLPADADPHDPASYAAYRGTEYAPDLIAEQARRFVRDNKDRPFFLYFATTMPHLALQAPDDSVNEYAGKFPETPYLGDNGYLPTRQPRATYAAMVTRLDRYIGSLLDLLKELGLEENTIVVFTSDNGPLTDGFGGTDSEFFDSTAGLKGRKGSFYEGGFRVPCIVRWPGKIAAGQVSDRVTGFEDWLPTFCDLAAQPQPTAPTDGVSFAPTLLGQPQEPRAFLYRESPGYQGQQTVRVGDWKVIRRNLHPAPRARDQAPGALELYNLATDRNETRNVAGANPAIVDDLHEIMDREHTRSTLFPIKALDGAAQDD